MNTLADLFEYSTKTYPGCRMSSFTDDSCAYTYQSFKDKVLELNTLLCNYGIGAQDKVMVLSENHPNWTAAFFSAVAFGRISVPVLPDSSPLEVNNIIEHSETRAVFASAANIAKISEENKAKLSLLVNLSTLEVLQKQEAQTPAKTGESQSNDLAAIIYTSGTSGRPKGVMVPHRAFISNCNAAVKLLKVNHKDIWLSLLPMAHTYEMTLGMVAPFFVGAKVYYLKGAPSVSILMPALQKVRPTLIPSVPLILEKIYRKSVLPTIQKSHTLTFMQDHFPGILYLIIGKKLKKTFGGRLKAIGIGGAKLDSEVERFLHAAHFPYAIGYGMTECAPLICLTKVGHTKVGSTGPAVPGMQVKINNPDRVTGEGEIVCKGPNVMLGYYKDAERTADMFTADGWMRTNDLAVRDARGRFYIKGRLNNMILGPSGENIYPEEIEMIINGLDGVDESLVISDKGHLVALVRMVDDVIKMSEEEKEKKKAYLMKEANSSVKKTSQITEVRFMEEPFVKTASSKIRRFLYNKEN